MRFVRPDEDAYRAALELRHRVFYRESGISLEDVPDLLENASLHLVALEADEVIGYGRLTHQGTEAQISQIVVEETRRKLGIGSGILTALMEAAANRGILHLHLLAQLDAVAFYRRFGFVEIGRPSPSPRLGIPVIRMERCGLEPGANVQIPRSAR